jgi:glycosyltransferase involved in cell wall biosynthesis
MTLSIITINRNNASGLEKTLKSIAGQTSKDFEHIIVDGASTDYSVELIRKYTDSLGDRVKWISEPDNGIYNAMNKGITMASGDYIQIMNSGDGLVSDDVTERMQTALKDSGYPSILYGNMLKDMPDGRLMRDKCFAGQEITFLGFYRGTLNHSPAYIRRSLFEKYGLYDENLRIVSDWKWYLQAIILGEEKPVYTDIDVTLFDMHGISETNLELRDKERAREMSRMIPSTFLDDYQEWSFPIEQMKRLKRHPWAYRLVWFLERILFKWERLKGRRK